MSEETLNGIEDMDPVGVQNDGEPAAVVTEPAPEPEVEATEPETEEEVEPETEKPKNKPGSAKYKEQRDAARAEAEALRQQLAQRQEAPKAPEPAGITDQDAWFAENPDKSYTDYLDLRAKTVAREEFRALQENNKIQAAISKTVDAGRAKFEDFDSDFAEIRAIAGSLPHQVLPEYVASVLIESEVGPELMHHFAAHPEELKRISLLPTAKASRELARLEVSFETPKAPASKPKTSQAPPPLKPVTPRAAVVQNDRFRGIEDF